MPAARKKATASAPYETIEIHRNDALAVLWLNRPDVRNAMNGTMVAELTRAFGELDADRSIRAVVIAARGEAFCAGADFGWLKKVAAFSPRENEADAMRTVNMLHALATMSKPTICRVQGAVFAGGLGLVAACDIAVASQGVEFCASEVKLGMVPATFSPYVIAAIGERAARRYFLTAERFDASEAYRIGLVQEIATADELDATINEMLGALMAASPDAVASAKDLIRSIAGKPLSPAVRTETAKRMAKGRASKEGKEGVKAFLEKRKPAWVTADRKA
jgi:methylglutaconyl-CoA hydratase